MTEQKQKQVEAEIEAAQAAGKVKCDDAYRAAGHVGLEEWRSVWNRMSDARRKAAAVKPDPGTVPGPSVNGTK